jgi:phage recombination protein Bet
MTETATAEAPTVDVSGADPAEGKSLATLRPEQQRWDENQIAILRQLGVEDATQGDLDLFFHYCRTTGLDPFRKQIYMIGRNTKVVEWVEEGNRRRKVERWVTKYTIQTGIDGYRRNGREAAKLLGDTLKFDGPYWCGDDGEWRDVWTSKSAPFAAKFTIYRNGEPFTGVAHFDEFVQTNNVYEGSGDSRKVVGEEPNSMWRKMPRNQIAKCAEALAWRRAYPDDFSGLILEDADQPTVIDQDGNVEQEPAKRESPGKGVAGMKKAREQRQQRHNIVDAEVVEDEPQTEEAQPEPEPSDLRKLAREKLNNEIFARFGELALNGDDKRDDRLDVMRAILDRPDLASSKELDEDALQKLRNELATRKSNGTLESDVRDWINAATLAREGVE